MTAEAIAQEVIAALRRTGFRAHIGSKDLSFAGNICTSKLQVPVRIKFEDLEFNRLPQIFVVDPDALPRRVFPHVNEKGELCVADRSTEVSDRYQAAGQVLGLIETARGLLEAGTTKSSTSVIAAEFPAHWGGTVIGVNMTPEEGPANFQKAKGVLELVGLPETGPKGLPSAWIVNTDAELSFLAHQARPKTLAEVLIWADSWDTNLRGKILDGLARQQPKRPLCMIVAPNGLVGFELLNAALAKTLKRKSAIDRLLRSRAWQNLKIGRVHGRRIDLPYVLGRSFDGRAPLADKKIVLVGCGCIGGFAAVGLSRLGAGLGSGKMSIVDPEAMTHSNVSRHVLGGEWVGEAKANGCRDLILKSTPGLNVESHPVGVEDRRHLCASADLVIDATGEEGIGDMLNAWRLEATRSGEKWGSLLHVWICGHGAAAQSFFSSDAEFACYRCLHPVHCETPRYWPLRKNAPTGPIESCVDSAFTPHGISAPMMAASLVATHAVDWAGGKPRKLLRTHVLDEKQAKMVKAANPEKKPRCPACGEESEAHRSGSDPSVSLVEAD